MLPAPSRLRRRSDFAEVVRRGARCGRSTVVVHLLPATGPSDGPPRVGFVVSRRVGGSVQRHRVTRQLRHIVAARLTELPTGVRVVVRARESAADCDSTRLDGDVAVALRRLTAG